MKLKKLNQKSGFTLLEIIVVIIIVGVLASVALPKLFSTIEFSRSTEALNALGVIRKSVDRCALMNNNTYNATCEAWAALDLTDPGLEPGAHFTYGIDLTTNAGVYVYTATRIALDGGNAGDTVVLTVDTTAVPPSVVSSGTGAFSNL